jgi:hypothetical protein
MKFKDIKFKEMNEISGGIQAIVDLGNGFEVSVVRDFGSYGNAQGLYEIGVFKGGTNKMVDPLDWGDTVKGWLLPSEVEQELELIKAL